MKNNFLNAMFSTSGVNLLATIINFIISLYLSKFLGASLRGEWTIIFTSIYLLATFLCFGFNQSLVYKISTNKKYTDTLNLIFVFICFGIILAAAIIIYLKEKSFLNILIPDKYVTSTVLISYFIWFIFLLVNQILIAILSGFEKFTQVNFSNLFFFISVLILLVIAQYTIVTPTKILTILFIYTVTTFVHFCINLYFLRFFFRENFKIKRLQIDLLFLKTSFFNFLTITLKYFLFRIDFWIVNYYLGVAQLGNYSLAAYLVQIIGLFSSSISTVLLSFFAKMDEEKSQRAIQLLVSLFFSITILLSFCSIPFLYFGIKLLFGRDFEIASMICGVLVLGMPFYSIIVILEAFNISRGKSKATIMPIAIGLLFSITLNNIIVKFLGIWGIAVVNILTYLLISIILMIYTKTLKSVIVFNIWSRYKEFRSLVL